MYFSNVITCDVYLQGGFKVTELPRIKKKFFKITYDIEYFRNILLLIVLNVFKLNYILKMFDKYRVVD